MKEPEKKAIEKYNELLGHVQLLEIMLDKCDTFINRNNMKPPFTAAVSHTSKCVSQEDGCVVFLLDYSLASYPENTPEGDESKNTFLSIKVSYRVIYNATAKLPKGFIKEFQNRNMQLNCWPYFRELVQNMTQRMNVPPLTLPLLRR